MKHIFNLLTSNFVIVEDIKDPRKPQTVIVERVTAVNIVGLARFDKDTSLPHKNMAYVMDILVRRDEVSLVQKNSDNFLMKLSGYTLESTQGQTIREVLDEKKTIDDIEKQEFIVNATYYNPDTGKKTVKSSPYLKLKVVPLTDGDQIIRTIVTPQTIKFLTSEYDLAPQVGVILRAELPYVNNIKLLSAATLSTIPVCHDVIEPPMIDPIQDPDFIRAAALALRQIKPIESCSSAPSPAEPVQHL